MFRRATIALSAAVALVALLAGIPIALAHLGGNPLSTIAAFVHTPLNPDPDGALLYAVLVVVGWAAWASFALGVLAELPALFGRRTIRIPGLSGQQWLAGLLLTAIAATTLATTVSSTRAAMVHPAVLRPAVVAAASDDSSAAMPHLASLAVKKAGAGFELHQVQRGEGMLDLAERYFHDPGAIGRIGEANYGILQPDGRTLQPGQTRIYPGWTLRIPKPANGVPSGLSLAHTVAATSVPGSLRYETNHGDYLWYISDRYLGDPDRYAEIVACNPDLITDPDLIQPGWVLVLPSDAHDRGPRAHASGRVLPPPAATPDDMPASAGPPDSSVNQPAPTTTVEPDVTPAPSTPASATAAEAKDNSKQSDTASVLLASGAWVTGGLVAAITTVVMLTRVLRRRNRQPRWPIPITHQPDEPELPAVLRPIAAAGLATLGREVDATGGLMPEGPPVPSVFGTSADGRQLSLHTDLASGVALIGPGADSAARAVIAAALSSSPTTWDRYRVELRTDARTLGRLLPTDTRVAPVAGLNVSADPDTAVNTLEKEVVYRRGFLDMYDSTDIVDLHNRPDAEPLELLVYLADADDRHAARIAAIADQGQPLDVVAITLGLTRGLPAAKIAADGTVAADTRPLHEARLSTLHAADLSEILDLLGQTASIDEAGNASAVSELDQDHVAPSAILTDEQRGPAMLASTSDASEHWAADSPQRPDHSRVRLTVLGIPTLTTAAGQVTTGLRANAYPLLCLLAAHPHGCTLDELVDALLPDATESEYARQTIRATITGLRAALRKFTGDQAMYVLHAEGRYRIDPDAFAVDLWEMHNDLNEASQAEVDDAALTLLRRASTAYGGEYATGVHLLWAEPQRTLYRRQATDALARIAEICETDDPESAIAALEAAIEHDPINEPLYQNLMRVQARYGRRDAVTRTMNLLRERLWTTACLEPSEASSRLRQRLLRGSP